MDEYELADRVLALPDRFSDRLDGPGVDLARSAANVGEWGEAVDLVLAGLVKTRATVTAQERDELATLVQAMQLETTASLDDLDVRDI